VTQAELAPLLQNNQFEQGLQLQGLQGLSSNYNTGIGAQSAAAGMLPAYTDASYAGYTPLLGASQLAGQLPYYGSQSLGTMGSLLGNYGTTTGTQPGGWGSDLISAGMAALPFIPGISDRRLKTNIRKLGEASDGLGHYSYRYVWDAPETVRAGVMADEVAKLRPWALGPTVASYMSVDYSKL
jgi:hypothetical protein